LKEWEQDLSNRPDGAAKTVAGTRCGSFQNNCVA
jgi:hypothetical protein